MAKAKGKGKAKRAVRRAGGRARKGMRRATKSAGHVGVAGGLLVSALEVAFTSSGATGRTPYGELVEATERTIGQRIPYVGKAIMGNLKNPSTYVPAAIGIAVSASTRIPIVKIAAKPLNAQVRSMTKGKMGL